MKRTINYVNIDGEKLSQEIERRGLTKAGISREMGYGHGFINAQIAQGKTRVSVVKYLQMKYNIDPESYEIPETVETPENYETPESVESVEIPIDYEALTAAIKAGVIDALSEYFDNEG